MKMRIFMNTDNAVYRVVIDTEDWSQGDIEAMSQFGEPEVNVGGDVSYTYDGEEKTMTLGDEFVRVLHGFPYCRGFDSRDLQSYDEAVALGKAWKDMVLGRIGNAVSEVRAKLAVLPTEEIEEI